MSRFLAPIHKWLFNKIIVFEELEHILIDKFEGKYGSYVKIIAEDAGTEYGKPLEVRPLEELIDTNNIHGWLQSKIASAETRQSAILTQVFNKYGEEAKEIAITIHAEHGRKCGLDAKDSYGTDTAPKIFNALNSYILDGMPCDNINSVVTETDDLVLWKSTGCLHRGYWETANADIELFYAMRKSWIESFVESSNSGYVYNEKSEVINGKVVLEKKIQKL